MYILEFRIDSFKVGIYISTFKICNTNFRIYSLELIKDSSRFRIYKTVFRMYKILKMRIFTSKRTSWEEFINVKEVGL
jgi:hypothetical protein